MAERSVNHSTFTVERTYDADPARVFAAWAEPEAKARWFGDPSQGVDAFELDFRIGGREFNRGTVEGQTYTFEARYQDIVPDERIVYAYDMRLDDARISVSLGTVEFKPDNAGTRLTYTEQGAVPGRARHARAAPAGHRWPVRRARPGAGPRDRLVPRPHPVTTANDDHWGIQKRDY